MLRFTLVVPQYEQTHQVPCVLQNSLGLFSTKPVVKLNTLNEDEIVVESNESLKVEEIKIVEDHIEINESIEEIRNEVASEGAANQTEETLQVETSVQIIGKSSAHFTFEITELKNFDETGVKLNIEGKFVFFAHFQK